MTRKELRVERMILNRRISRAKKKMKRLSRSNSSNNSQKDFLEMVLVASIMQRAVMRLYLRMTEHQTTSIN